MKKIKVVGFDLDRTIADTIPLCIEAFEKAVAPYAGGSLSREDIVQTFGLNEEGMVREIVGERWREIMPDFYRIYREMHDLCPEPFDGIRDILEMLCRAGVIIVLITGKGERSCSITLEKFGMSDIFEKVETSSPDRNRKAEAITSVIEKYGIIPAEMVYVGDAISDITASRKAGVRCLSAAWASTAEPQKLRELNGENVFDTVAGLWDFLKNRI